MKRAVLNFLFHTKRQDQDIQHPDDYLICKDKYKILWHDFKNTKHASYCIVYYIIRYLICSFVIAIMANTPIVTLNLIFSFNLIFIYYLYKIRPFKNVADVSVSIVIEVILLVIWSFISVLAILDYFDEQGKEFL